GRSSNGTQSSTSTFDRSQLGPMQQPLCTYYNRQGHTYDTSYALLGQSQGRGQGHMCTHGRGFSSMMPMGPTSNRPPVQGPAAYAAVA
ncbi:hypothetical protein Ancab_022131, partial [Ancistrocladus abbreviatus]